jgi:hypothetical protein
MTLSKEQIDQLFLFTEKKFVRYYDLQVELVDHLAERIEEEMEANKALSFETALQKVYTSFGLFGFAHVVQEKQNALYKQSWRLWAKELRNFFTFPKVIFTTALFLVAYTLGTLLTAELRFIILFTTFLAFTIYQPYCLYRYKKVSVKNLLLLEITPYTTVTGPFLLTTHFFFLNQEIHSSMVFGILSALAYIMEAAVIQVSGKVQKQAQQLYPDAFVTS